MLGTNSTRGVSFDPSVARRRRESERQIRAVSPAPSKPVARRDGSPREYGMYLDQSNQAWRERARDRKHSN